MRKLNECRAEVFRRSSERIKQRRRTRTRVIVGCITMCLIITVGSVVGMQVMRPVEKDMPPGSAGSNISAGSANNAADEYTNYILNESTESSVCSYTEAEIRNTYGFPEHYEKVTDKVEVDEIFMLINSFFTGIDRVSEDDKEYQFVETFGCPSTDATEKLLGYIVTLTMEDGSQTVYNINKNRLLNLSTNERIIITDAGLAKLMTLLGIS